MKYTYPAIFKPAKEGGYNVEFPDLPGCFTCGEDLADAMLMAKDAIELWLWTAETDGIKIPKPSTNLTAQAPDFVNLIAADTLEYAKQYDNKAVKKNLTIPNWLNTNAEKAGVNFSQVLQEALKHKLDLS